MHQCSEAGSLHGITWANLRSQLDGIELRKIYGLNPLAQEFIPRYLLFSAVPHPMTLIPPGAPVQCFPYPRPITYSPNIISTLPVSYPPNPQGFFPSSASFGTPISAAKTVEAQKVNPLGSYHTTIPYPSLTGFYPNRAALLPFPPSPAIASFPTLAVSNIFPTATTNPSFPSGLVQHPTLGGYMPSALPYQPKVNIFPQVIQARPPPGFNASNPNYLDQIRVMGKASQQQQMMPQNMPLNSLQSSAQEPQTQSPSPDKSIQYFNNVHFPKRRDQVVDNHSGSILEEREQQIEM